MWEWIYIISYKWYQCLIIWLTKEQMGRGMQSVCASLYTWGIKKLSHLGGSPMFWWDRMPFQIPFCVCDDYVDNSLYFCLSLSGCQREEGESLLFSGERLCDMKLKRKHEICMTTMKRNYLFANRGGWLLPPTMLCAYVSAALLLISVVLY